MALIFCSCFQEGNVTAFSETLYRKFFLLTEQQMNLLPLLLTKHDIISIVLTAKAVINTKCLKYEYLNLLSSGLLCFFFKILVSNM